MSGLAQSKLRLSVELFRGFLEGRPDEERWELIDGVPVIVVENGRPIKEFMDKARVDEQDILESARRLRALERMDQIKYAVLERDGTITIIPRKNGGN